MKTRSIVALVGAALVLALAVAGPAYAVSVSIGDNFYSPKTVTVAVGDTVTWTNDGQASHTVTANNGSFDSSPSCPSDFNACMQPGDTYSHTFNAAGSFAYFCKVHGQAMSGTVVVEGSGGTTPPPSSTTSGSPLPNTGADANTLPFIWLGLGFLLTGGVALFALRRGRA